MAMYNKIVEFATKGESDLAVIRRCAILSRIGVLVLSAVSNFLKPDRDYLLNAGVFLSPSDPREVNSFGDELVALLFGGLVRWDAQYFFHIAKYGYTYENTLAFFPLLPVVVRGVATILFLPLQFVLNFSSVVLISFVVMNFVFFIKSAGVLYELSAKVLGDNKVARTSALFFCVNPASIFFTAPYSECLYSLVSFYGMLKCLTASKDGFLTCAVYFGLSGATRSNGLTNIGYIVHENLKIFLNDTFPSLLAKVRAQNIFVFVFVFISTLVLLLPMVNASLIAIIPFATFEAYSFHSFCFRHRINVPKFILKHARANKFLLPGSKIPRKSFHWCNGTLPLSYSYVQDRYWKVGFLNYYEIKQIPNFLLAIPIFVLIFSQSFKYFRCYPKVLATLGISEEANKKEDDKPKEGYTKEMFVYVVHAVALSFVCLLFIHVQVSTRLLASACPVVYWYAALTFHSNNKASVYVKWYFLVYAFVGTVLFSNFLPWT